MRALSLFTPSLSPVSSRGQILNSLFQPYPQLIPRSPGQDINLQTTSCTFDISHPSFHPPTLSPYLHQLTLYSLQSRRLKYSIHPSNRIHSLSHGPPAKISILGQPPVPVISHIGQEIINYSCGDPTWQSARPQDCFKR